MRRVNTVKSGVVDQWGLPGLRDPLMGEIDRHPLIVAAVAKARLDRNRGRWVSAEEVLPPAVRWYRRHRAAGLCVRCSEVAAPGHALCAGHLAAYRDAYAIRRAARNAVSRSLQPCHGVEQG